MGSNAVLAIAPGAEVTMHFRLAIEDGTEADNTFGDEPLTFTVGDGTLLPAIEAGLMGLTEGARHTLILDPDAAYGWPDTGNIHELPRSDFDPDMPLEPGLVIGFSTPSGEELPGIIMEVGEESVRVNFNHPLAGHQITMEVEVLTIKPALNS